MGSEQEYFIAFVLFTIKIIDSYISPSFLTPGWLLIKALHASKRKITVGTYTSYLSGHY